MNRLRTRLTLLILGGAVFSILLVSIIANGTILKNFDTYMEKEQEKRLESFLQLVKESYASNNGWTKGTFNEIRNSSLTRNFDIEIKDADNNLVFTSSMENTMVQMHNEMRNRMGHGMMRRNRQSIQEQNLREENYVVDQYDMVVDNQRIGSITIGQVGPFLISESDIEFTKGVNNAILYGAMISIAATILLGVYSSKIFLVPILRITQSANDIREGKLDTEVMTSGNIIELRDLSVSINHLSKSLKEQELLRKRLTSDISHELRTPLTILQSHIEAISDGVWEPTQDKLEICKAEVHRLIKLVDELKHLTDIENHQLDLEIHRYCLSKDLNEVVTSFQYQFQEKGVLLNRNIKENIEIYGDKNKIRQAVVNLISNAFKFTSSGGTVTVELLENQDEVEIVVKDTGMGIDQQDIPYVFERFYRGDASRNRKTGGAGIGLSITKTLVEAHGGNIIVESEKNKGTKFIIRLPKEKSK
ncbi:sensor histidine kinase [Alkaliphilus oremlandii]|uniref:histidine kinase n=1 Tax=Alkaliphilus oremlandii (strain OhILAs) TaxID=350688 RepID=A8MIR9_ALKOO|nr:HAMP domain-containing sensor histidine kinase [Alkaliphilus oremlandii]ABW19701.1 integral membrane sensor signal transduction histidine kinase [Alkaliphilus oremlandii OhILAs]